MSDARTPGDILAAMDARTEAIQKLLAPHAEKARRALVTRAAVRTPAHRAEVAALAVREQLSLFQKDLRALAAAMDRIPDAA